MIRISMDAKASVKVGDFSRGGKKRVQVKAADHDFPATARVTPVGILLPQFDELFLACVTCHPSPAIVWSMCWNCGGTA